MSTPFSVFTTLLYSIIFLSCNSDNRVESLQKELDANKKLLAECQNKSSESQSNSSENGIAFKKTTNPSDVIIKLNVIYTYKNGHEVQEIITFNYNDSNYNFHTFLNDCDGKMGVPQVTFYAIQNPGESGNPAGVKYALIQADNMPRRLQIDQPGDTPAYVTFTISTDKQNPCTQQSKKGIQATAVYTVEMN